MAGNDSDQRYSEQETARRRAAVLKRMLNTPPQPRAHKAKTAKRRGRIKAPSSVKDLRIGTFTDRDSIPDEVRSIMRANSDALDHLTKKAPG